MLGVGFGGQSLDHIYFGESVYNGLHGQLPYEQLTMPLVLIASHVACDHYFGEGNLGPDLSSQIMVNGIFAWAGYLMMNTDKKRDEYIYVTFWSSIVPDTILKAYLHNGGSHLPQEQHEFNFTHQQEVEMMGLELIGFKYLF